MPGLSASLLVLTASLAVSMVLDGAQCFLVTVTPRFGMRSIVQMHAKRSPSFTPEYSVNEELGGGFFDHTNSMLPKPEPTNGVVEAFSSHSVVDKGSGTGHSSKPTLQYAAMEPGTVAQIQIGDTRLARKAWKKRRRTGSPLLVPCSVLNVDRRSILRWNIMYLLSKFGSAANSGSIRIDLAELTRRHRTHLQSSLTQQAVELGFGTAHDLVQALFSKQVQDSYGVQLAFNDSHSPTTTGTSSSLWLQAPLSRTRAQKRASGAVVLQFSHADAADHTLQHTGIVRNKRNDSTTNSKGYRYQLQPLSAALRVSQADLDSGTIPNGSLHAAVVFDYDATGDAGAPLLILSLNPAQVRDRLKIVPDKRHEVIRKPRYVLNNLRVGDGPISAKVTRIVKGGALVDCSVGRKSSSTMAAATDFIKVYGLLRFPDAVASNGKVGSGGKLSLQQMDEADTFDDEVYDEEDLDSIFSFNDLDDSNDDGEDITHMFDMAEDGSLLLQDPKNGETKVISMADEEEEDITHLFEMMEDGSLTFKDPETGETKIIHMDGHDEEDEEDNDDIGDIFVEGEVAGTTGEDDNIKGSKPFAERADETTSSYWGSMSTTATGKPQWLHIGDQIDVYVKSAGKKLGRQTLTFTMDSSVKGKKAKDIKKQGNIHKRLDRLAKQLGGLHLMDQLRGQQCDGIVKATSFAGDWVYVQATTTTTTTGSIINKVLEGSGGLLPVGVATASDEGELLLLSRLEQGDNVRIQIEGIDRDRGQLAFRVLSKLQPVVELA
jgi:hypothetical protein